ARVLEGVQSQALVGDRLEEPRRDDPIGVDVVTRDGNAPPRDLSPHALAHFIISRTSATAPWTAAATAMAGLISRVRPVGLPWRPMKLRLLVDALISRPLSLSSFMPRHIEQPRSATRTRPRGRPRGGPRPPPPWPPAASPAPRSPARPWPPGCPWPPRRPPADPRSASSCRSR